MGVVQESLRRMHSVSVAWMAEHANPEIRRRYFEQAEELDVLVESVLVKLQLVALYSEILTQSYATLPSSERSTHGTASYPMLLEATTGINLEIQSHDAGLLARVAAFSGAVSACVNSADTLAQFLQRVYGLDLPSEPNMHHLCGVLSPHCLLAGYIAREKGLDWMGRLRGLRAECQHGAVLRTFIARMGQGSTIPYVDAQWSADGTERLVVSDFVQRIRGNAERLLAMVADVVASSPQTAIQARSV